MNNNYIKPDDIKKFIRQCAAFNRLIEDIQQYNEGAGIYCDYSTSSLLLLKEPMSADKFIDDVSVAKEFITALNGEIL